MSSSTLFNENDVLNALRVLPAPYLSTDVVSAGMVSDITIDGGDLALTMEFFVPSKGFEDRLVNSAREALSSHLPQVNALKIGTRISIPGQDSPQKSAIIPGVKNTIAVASGKGGVGKSTVAVNIAVSLARAGARVGLVDADIYGPSIPLMLGINEQPGAYVDDGKTRLLPIKMHVLFVMSIGFLIEPDSALIWRGPMASGALKQFLTDVDWAELDYLVFDMPPGTGDIQLTLSQTLPLTGAVIVTTPQDVSLADARKGVRMFERVSVPILGIIENMSHHICPNCGHREDIFGSGGGRATADDLGVPFLGEIPLVARVRESGDSGEPIAEAQPESPIAASFMETSMTLAGRIASAILNSPPPPSIDISLNAE